MTCTSPQSHHDTNAPQGFRDALVELVQIGMRVAQMVGEIADAETALAKAAAQARLAEGVSAQASSLAEAIEADRAAAAAAEMRQTVVARTEAVERAFARVSRSVRLTMLLAERFDRGWARGRSDDRHAMPRREVARGVAGATEAGERTVRLTEALRDRLEMLDTEVGIGDRSAEEIIGEICRDLGLDPVHMTVRSPLPDAIGVVEAGQAAPLAGGRSDWDAGPPQRRPDG